MEFKYIINAMRKFFPMIKISSLVIIMIVCSSCANNKSIVNKKYIYKNDFKTMELRFVDTNTCILTNKVEYAVVDERYKTVTYKYTYTSNIDTIKINNKTIPVLLVHFSIENDTIGKLPLIAIPLKPKFKNRFHIHEDMSPSFSSYKFIPNLNNANAIIVLEKYKREKPFKKLIMMNDFTGLIFKRAYF